MKKLLRWLTLLALLALLILAALDTHLAVRRYTVETDKLDAPVHLAVLTDLHGCDYGPDGAELLAILAEEQPDCILLSGDMFSADGDPEEELRFFRSLVDLAPTFYVTGNHEYWEYDVPALAGRIAATGVMVLDQTSVTLTVKGQRVNLCGVPDPSSGADVATALARAAEAAAPGAYTVLLAHRPELIAQYAATGDFDLVVSGHAHGGQVRLPGLVNGLYAPNQGFFPAYVGGRYDVDSTVMIVSRGLSTQVQWVVPRVFNRPEIILVTSE